MAESTNELMFELLKKIHADVSALKEGHNDLRQEFISMRGTMVSIQSDVHNIYGTLYRQDDRLDRIEKRLDLRELAEAQANFSRDT